MEIATWHEHGAVPVTIIQVKGDLDATEPLESRARSAFQEGARDVVLDLNHVNYISSAGLRAIHSVYTLLRSADPTDEETAARGIARGTYKSPHLKLVKPSKNGMKALTTAGYDMFLDVYDNIHAAVGSLMKSLTLRYSTATVRDLNDIREFLESAIQTLGGDDDVAGDLVLAVNEAVTNVLLHGYEERPGVVSVGVEADGDNLLVRLIDEAYLFDPTAVPPPDINLPLEDRPLGGLGVHMMRQLTDELVYRVTTDGKNELIFVKRGVLAGAHTSAT